MKFFTPAKSLNTADSQTCIQNHAREDVTIPDTRQPSEYGKEHLPGAILMPLPELSDRLDELKKDKPIRHREP